MTTEAKLLEALQMMVNLIKTSAPHLTGPVYEHAIAAISHPTAAEQAQAIASAAKVCDSMAAPDMAAALRGDGLEQPQAPEQGVACFEREQRYIVFKLTDLRRFLSIDEIQQLYALEIKVDAYREQAGKGRLTALVVEHDWPEYEPTWKAIEQRVAGPTPPAPKLEPMTESEAVACLVKSGCVGTVKMSYDSGPYEITRTSANADKLIRAVEAHHGISTKGAV